MVVTGSIVDNKNSVSEVDFGDNLPERFAMLFGYSELKWNGRSAAIMTSIGSSAPR